jgi:hypothetical protein
MISTYVKCHHPRKFDVCTLVHITFIKLNNLVDFSGRWVLHERAHAHIGVKRGPKE